MPKLLDELRSKRSEIIKIAAKYGISNIRVFGSVARGEEKKNSDVDFLVKQNKGVSLFEIVEFKRDIEKFLGKKVDVVLEDGVSKFLKKIIFDEAVLI